jgi:rRNA-processing protein FCF1
MRPGARIAVPTAVLEELRRLVARGVRGAAVALALAERLPSIRTDSRGDAAVVDAALAGRAAVVTADKALATRLHTAGVDVLVPRDRHHLELRRGRARAEGASLQVVSGEPAGRRQRL